jgi:prevent-host-death family protein
MDSFNVHEAKTHFSRILARVQAGEEVIIAKAGQPIARIVPVRTTAPRQPDTEQGRLTVAEDFDAPLPDDLLQAFESRT